MKLSELISIAGSEEKSEEFLRTKGILKTFKFCPFCGGKSIGRVRRNFFKCYNCRREWSVRRDSILEDLKVPFSKFLLAVKLFVLEVPVNRAYRELEVKRGSIIYTDRFRSYDGLVMYGFRHERIDHGKRFANGKVYINGIEGFWSYAKERLLKFHGVRRENFVYYIKELEFRYNNRDNLEEVLYKVLGGIY
jgi:transposase-like protein